MKGALIGILLMGLSLLITIVFILWHTNNED